jgi:hypothetical protein
VAREEIYIKVKIVGLLMFIPLVMGTGPLAGFFAGEYLRRRFGLPVFTTYILAAAGFAAAAIETVKIIRLIFKSIRKP